MRAGYLESVSAKRVAWQYAQRSLNLSVLMLDTSFFPFVYFTFYSVLYSTYFIRNNSLFRFVCITGPRTMNQRKTGLCILIIECTTYSAESARIRLYNTLHTVYKTYKSEARLHFTQGDRRMYSESQRVMCVGVRFLSRLLFAYVVPFLFLTRGILYFLISHLSLRLCLHFLFLLVLFLSNFSILSVSLLIISYCLIFILY